jgi:hypothetical protein
MFNRKLREDLVFVFWGGYKEEYRELVAAREAMCVSPFHKTNPLLLCGS